MLSDGVDDIKIHWVLHTICLGLGSLSNTTRQSKNDIVICVRSWLVRCVRVWAQMPTSEASGQWDQPDLWKELRFTNADQVEYKVNEGKTKKRIPTA